TTAQSEPAGMASERYAPAGMGSGAVSVPVHVKPPGGPAAPAGDIAIVSAPPPAMAVAAKIVRAFMAALSQITLCPKLSPQPAPRPRRGCTVAGGDNGWSTGGAPSWDRASGPRQTPTHQAPRVGMLSVGKPSRRGWSHGEADPGIAVAHEHTGSGHGTARGRFRIAS